MTRRTLEVLYKLEERRLAIFNHTDYCPVMTCTSRYGPHRIIRPLRDVLISGDVLTSWCDILTSWCEDCIAEKLTTFRSDIQVLDKEEK